MGQHRNSLRKTTGPRLRDLPVNQLVSPVQLRVPQSQPSGDHLPGYYPLWAMPVYSASARALLRQEQKVTREVWSIVGSTGALLSKQLSSLLLLSLFQTVCSDRLLHLKHLNLHQTLGLLWSLSLSSPISAVCWHLSILTNGQLFETYFSVCLQDIYPGV